jgi:hypothetical protein
MPSLQGAEFVKQRSRLATLRLKFLPSATNPEVRGGSREIWIPVFFACAS